MGRYDNGPKPPPVPLAFETNPTYTYFRAAGDNYPSLGAASHPDAPVHFFSNEGYFLVRHDGIISAKKLPRSLTFALGLEPSETDWRKWYERFSWKITWAVRVGVETIILNQYQKTFGGWESPQQED